MIRKFQQTDKKNWSKLYNGYAVGNVPSNMTPLTVYHAAKDHAGITVDNQGNVKDYTNFNINKKNMSKKQLERFFSIELRDLVRSNRVNSLLVWYAGHGKFINETGYWVPTDAKRDDEFTYFNINNLTKQLFKTQFLQ